MRVFVSSQAADQRPARDLITGLRDAGVEVEHSPSNPLDRTDPRWTTWYDHGLGVAIAKSDAFVIVLDKGWDSSTWMGIEAEAALKSPNRTATNAYIWNPDGIVVSAAGMVPYLRPELPRNLAQAVGRLRESAV